MIIDISSYNGTIDFDTLIRENDIERVIMRSTLKTGAPDSALSANISRLRKADTLIPIDFYKFTYARNYADAVLEATDLLYTLKSMLLLNIPEFIYLDIEPVNGKAHTAKEIAEIIAGYLSVFERYEIPLGIYCSYSYLVNMPVWSRELSFWVARWNSTLGDIYEFDGFDVKMWQYSDKGNIAGINGPVDLSRYV